MRLSIHILPTRFKFSSAKLGFGIELRYTEATQVPLREQFRLGTHLANLSLSCTLSSSILGYFPLGSSSSDLQHKKIDSSYSANEVKVLQTVYK